ncbi:hypothetical protein VP1G_07756 [Cytospora mali]|uniref:Cytochrome b561 domain-containing protein n=1 Tax=Cytospora mali TaxID=578113 RepID=A0A194V9F3_CYTMA|nr:hypothetical protein VP1G_07756 [Valsa mali var. pyri (nom. inval.)]
MAPLDEMSQPGTASYDSDTMTVGDGTWDFTKNDFLLPNLVGLNFETMRYNAHGIIGTIVFLFIVPIAIFYVRFYTRRPGYAVRYHAYLQITAVLLTTAVFVLGWFAVGPERSLTNPHHGIGVAIYTLILVQIIGGRLIKNIRGRSLRVMLHQWFGRTIALLGIAQVPLGLTLYGSPRYTFILFALWMAFLLFLYFVLEYRAGDRPDYVVRDGRSEIIRTERKSSGDRSGWLWPLAAGGAALALLRGRNRDRSRSRSRSRSRASRLGSRSRSRAPEVIPSRHHSFVDDEKYTDRYSERPKRSSASSGGFMDRLLGVGAGLGAGALIARMMGKRERNRDDEEYSAVATDTPSRRRGSRSGRRHGGTVLSDYSDESEEYYRGGRRTPLLPGPGVPSAMAAAISAAESRPGGPRAARPMTPQPTHRRDESTIESTLESDYSSYVSPSRRSPEKSRSNVGAADKNRWTGVGLGWFAKKMWDRRESRDEDKMRVEEDRRAGQYSPRYTGDGYSTPPRRRDSRRAPIRPVESRTGTSLSRLTDEESLIDPRPTSGYEAHPPLERLPATAYRPPPTATTESRLTEEESLIEPRPLSGYEAHPPLERLPTTAYRPPPTAGPAPPPVGQYAPAIIPVPAGNTSHSHTQSRHNVIEPVSMPPMPPDPKGLLASSESDSFTSRRDRRRSESRQRAVQDAAATAAAKAGMLAAEEEAQRRVEHERSDSRDRTPVSVQVKVHDDKDRNVTLRRLTEEEALAARRARRRRTDSTSSISGSDAARGGSRPRYRRDTSRRRAAEDTAESAAEESLGPLSPPAPAFAGGRRPKEAPFSGQPQQQAGPAGATPAAGTTLSSLGSMASPGSHETWSGMSPVGTNLAPLAPMHQGPSDGSVSASASAADRRRRRRLERRDGRAGAGGVDFT